VDLWLARYAELGVAGLLDRPRAAGHEQVPARIRSRLLALSRQSPPLETGLSHWSSRELARYVSRTTGQMTRLRVTEFAFVGLATCGRVGWPALRTQARTWSGEQPSLTPTLAADHPLT
jgi:hypothetical protein